MARKASKSEKKVMYDEKLCKMLDEYTQILVVSADNVRSSQLQSIRNGLRGDSVLLMGKNTMMKRSIRIHSDKTRNTTFLTLVPLLVGNVGLIFTKGDLKEVKEEVVKYKVGAPARVGLVAPIDVIVPPGNTGLDPSQTSFFQVLNIPTKINKGTIEIITPVELIKKGDKVGSSEASLLSKLGIRPFSYGLIAENVYDNGSVFSPEVLDLTGDVLVSNFVAGVSMVSSLALAVSYPTLAAAPHMLINGFKNLLVFAIASEYSFKVKEYPKGLEYNSPSSDEEDPVMTREQSDIYYNSVRESDGFDVIRPAGVVEFGIISPKSLERKDLVFHTKMAIEVFNKTSHKDVEGELVFDKVLKAMAQAICGIRFYLTFNAKNLLKNDICTYQAVVLRGSGRDDEVESFRAMPSGSKKEYFWETHLSC